MMNDGGAEEWLHISNEVASGLRARRAVVALESTVIAHGLPRPQNLRVAEALEAVVREGGAIPATVAVIDGRPTVGLTSDEMRIIASADGVEKLSTRELPLAIARRVTGATTVAATASLAHRSGIEIFATGGIGGVHRGFPPDISADLMELRNSQLIVVCAGAKSILDVPATRELLETLGVLVLGWKTDRFPAFYTRESESGVDARVETAEEVAEIWRAHRALAAGGAVLLCVPIPEEDSLDAAWIDEVTGGALEDAESTGIRGKEITPYLLKALSEATRGATLKANIALLENNARVAAMIASSLGRRDGR